MFGQVLKYHIVHYVTANEIALGSEGTAAVISDDETAAFQFVKTLYTNRETEVNDVFMRHFDILDDLETTVMDLARQRASYLKTSPTRGQSSASPTVELQKIHN